MDNKELEISLLEQKETNYVLNKDVKSFKDNFIELLKNSVPAYFATIIDVISTSISIAFVGHLNSANELAAVGIAETFALILFYYPVLSNMGAIDTFVSTSYGNKQYYLCGVYFNRALLILTLFAIPFISILFFAENIMLFLGQDPLISEMAQTYFYYRIPALMLMLYDEIVRGYLQALGYFNFLSVLVVVQLISHILFLILFINVLEMNYIGSAIAMGFSSLVGLILPFVYFKLISSNKLQS